MKDIWGHEVNYLHVHVLYLGNFLFDVHIDMAITVLVVCCCIKSVQTVVCMVIR